MNTHTPAERAALALTNPAVMCSLLNEARCTRFPGYWDGSAFRSHPCGIIDGTIKFTNDWHCDDFCSIAITNGDGWDRNVCQDSRAYGNPHPKATNGDVVGVWSGGGDSAKWASEQVREKVEPRVLAVLTAAAEHVERVHAAQKVAQEQEAEKRRAAAASAQAAALAKL